MSKRKEEKEKKKQEKKAAKAVSKSAPPVCLEHKDTPFPAEPFRTLISLESESLDFRKGYMAAMNEKFFTPTFVVRTPCGPGVKNKGAFTYTSHESITTAMQEISFERVPGTVLFGQLLHIPKEGEKETVAKKKNSR